MIYTSVQIGKYFGSVFVLHLWFLHITAIGHEFWLHRLLKICGSRQALWGVKLGEKSVYYYLPNVFLWQSRREVRHVWYLRCMIFRNQCQRLWEWLVCGHIHGGNMLFLVSEHPIKINLCMAHCWYQFMLTHPYQWALSAGFLFGSLFPWTRDVVVLSLPLLLSVLSPVTPFPQVFFPVKAF